jgi:PIN domain nuclease of toxin-antitoxin system
VLVDAHVLLWFLAGDSQRVKPALRERIEAEPATVSAATFWEIAIKRALGKLDAPDDLPARVEQLGFGLLPVAAEHAWRVRELPPHHRDPFDRLLIAQAQLERLPIATADAAFERYDVVLVRG